MKKLKFRFIYWVPNSLAEERIAIGLSVYYSDLNKSKVFWISKSEFNRINKVYSKYNFKDVQDYLTLYREIEEIWEAKSLDNQFWNYLERYYTGTIQVSDEKTVHFEGTKSEFDDFAESLKNKLLPLANQPVKRGISKSRSIQKSVHERVKKFNLQKRVNMDLKIPAYDPVYHLISPFQLDVATENGQIIGGSEFNLSLKEDTKSKKALAIIDGYQKIKEKDERGFELSLFIHSDQKAISESDFKSNFDDAFRHRCKDLSIQLVNLGELDDYFADLTKDKEDLKPFFPATNEN